MHTHFVYDDDESNLNQKKYEEPFPFKESPRVTVKITPDFQHRAVINDVEAVHASMWPLPISIESIDKDTLQFELPIARFYLVFNYKYPLEAPKMKYLGPHYDFLTMIQLSIDFKKFRHKEWSIRESLVSILDDVLAIVLNKQPIIVEDCLWTEEESICIDFLKEIDCFQNLSYFEDVSSCPRMAGKGIGYGGSGEYGHGAWKKKRKSLAELFSTVVGFPSLMKILDAMNVLDILASYVKKNTYLNIAEIRESLLLWTRRFPGALALRAAVEHKTQFKQFIPTLQKGPNLFIMDDDTLINNFVSTHYFGKKAIGSNISMKSLYSRIFLEVMDLAELSQEENFRIAWCPTGPFQLLRLLLTSGNDPYYGGMFEFHVFFPSDYPSVPPCVQFMTTASGTVRFNPNLYTCGKVCLSLLGTWSGEQWNPSLNNMVHVVLALSVMIFTDQPVQNEPAYSSVSYFDPSSTPQQWSSELLMVRKYKFYLRFMTLQHAILSPLSDTSSLFYHAVWDLFEKNRDAFLAQTKDIIAATRDDSFPLICQAKCFQSHQTVVNLDFASSYETMIDQITKLRECLVNRID